MFHRLFAGLLIALIASQSVLAAVDVHLDMQSGDEHQQANHNHSGAPVFSTVSSDQNLLHSLVDIISDHEVNHIDAGSEDFGEQSADCQHCCHCHNGSQVLASVLPQPNIMTLRARVFGSTLRPGSLKFPPALRPPIV
jgi:hypothetical protein